jgi:hypothetical protein
MTPAPAANRTAAGPKPAKIASTAPIRTRAIIDRALRAMGSCFDVKASDRRRSELLTHTLAMWNGRVKGLK